MRGWATSHFESRGLTLTAVANFEDDFDESLEEDRPSRMLPLEDRLWRHPSEVFKSPAPLDPLAVRRRWLQTQPSRASAWSAGVVGALLATGLVVLGTHLAGALAGDSLPTPALSSAAVTTVAPTVSVSPQLAGFGRSVDAEIARNTRSMALITISATGATGEELGLVVNSAGFLVIPSSGLKGGVSILVTLGNGVEYVGQIVGEIPSEGLTVVHVNGATNLSTAAFASNGEIDPGSLAVAITSIKGASVVTTLRAMTDLPQIGGSTIEKALTSDLNVASVALGTPLISGVGHVEGVVVGSTNGVLVVAPGSLVADEVHAIIEQQVFSTASLGITVTSQTANNGVPAGILISAEARNSSASSAGVATGDLIVGVNGITVTSLDGFENALREAAPTSPLVLTVYTNQLPHTVIVPATVSLTP